MRLADLKPCRLATPSTLSGVIRYFADPGTCLAFVTAMRWPAGVRCECCRSRHVTLLRTRPVWKCRGCHRQFSVKTGTIFEDSPLGFEKWLPVLWVVVNRRNVSTHELARRLRVTQKTAWFMVRRVRMVMRTAEFSQVQRDGILTASRQAWAAPGPGQRLADPLLPRGTGVVVQRARWRGRGSVPHCARNRWRARRPRHIVGPSPKRPHDQGVPAQQLPRFFTQLTAVRKVDVWRAHRAAGRW